ncbi:MAG: hypothetical protein KGJ89_05460 [Patescibacteria group bacterium]|nr:hypothetical protein [Patescibacteria group bacterium]
MQPETEKWLRALRISQKWLYGRTLAQMAGEEDETYRLALQNNYAATRRITLRAIMEMTPMGEPVYDNPEDEDFDGSYPYDD